MSRRCSYGSSEAVDGRQAATSIFLAPLVIIATTRAVWSCSPMAGSTTSASMHPVSSTGRRGGNHHHGGSVIELEHLYELLGGDPAELTVKNRLRGYESVADMIADLRRLPSYGGRSDERSLFTRS